MEPQIESLELRTERLVLRPPRMSDAVRIAELIGNWNVIRWLAMPPYPYKLEDAERFITRMLNREPTGENSSLMITADGKLIGNVGIGSTAENSRAQFGYWLGEPYWAKGFMTEAVSAALENYFASIDRKEIYSGILVGNRASLCIQEKLGFEIVGESEIYCVPRQETLPHLDTRLTRETFEARRR